VEASALQAPAALPRTRVSLGAPLLRLRSDEQLVALFRAGHDEAFRAIYDRYHQRLFAYTRQMLPGSRQDAEDALQDVFVRAYANLRENDRKLALRAWLYRVAHNRCIDELRRPRPPLPELIELVRSPVHDPIAQAEQRESLRRLIADVRRLPEQQRSALLMRELSGMAYTELSTALGVSVPAVKSLLVRARVGLVQALEARDTACSEIRDELILAHDRGVRPNATARRHMRDCGGCRQFRGEVRGVSRQFGALVPALGPIGLVANLLGLGGGGSASGTAAAGGGAAAAGGAVGTGGAFAATGVFATGASHIATLLAAAVVTAGGAVEIQSTIAAPVKHRTHHHAVVAGTEGSMGTGAVSPSASAVSAAASSVTLAPVMRARAAASATKAAPDVAAAHARKRPAAKHPSATRSPAAAPLDNSASSANPQAASGGSPATPSDASALAAIPANGTATQSPVSLVNPSSTSTTSNPTGSAPGTPANGTETGTAGASAGAQGASSTSSSTQTSVPSGSTSGSGSPSSTSPDTGGISGVSY
jgi:RNA polymerase sigma factor (sigma-70 family)